MVEKQLLHTEILDDSTLWNSLKEGNENAFSILFKRHYSHLVRYGNSFLPFPEKVQDCVQDVFTDLWIYRDKLSDKVVVKAYLLACVRKRITRSQVGPGFSAGNNEQSFLSRIKLSYKSSSRLSFSSSFTMSPTFWDWWRLAIRSASGVSTMTKSSTPTSATSFLPAST
jgi:hypothetical protein